MRFDIWDWRGWSLIDELAAVLAGAGAEVDEVVGGGHDGLFVFDDDEGVAFVAQAVHDADEALDVPRMQADGGLVEHKQSACQRRPEASGEVDAFDLAAGERAGVAIKREITEADFVEVGKARGDFGEDEIEGGVGRGIGDWRFGIWDLRFEICEPREEVQRSGRDLERILKQRASGWRRRPRQAEQVV